METIAKLFELQIDEMPTGVVLRLNDEQCRLRICKVPKQFVLNADGTVREFIDITYPTPIKGNYNIEALKGDIANLMLDISATIVKYLEENGNPDIKVTPLLTYIMRKGTDLANATEENLTNPDNSRQKLRDELIDFFISLHEDGYIDPFEDSDELEPEAEKYVDHYLNNPARKPSIGAFHMSTIPAFKSLFKPFNDGGCEFIYGSPPRDEQCTKPAAYEIKSSIKGKSTGNRYLVCEKHRDELYNYIKGLDPDATIEPIS